MLISKTSAENVDRRRGKEREREQFIIFILLKVCLQHDNIGWEDFGQSTRTV